MEALPLPALWPAAVEVTPYLLARRERACARWCMGNFDWVVAVHGIRRKGNPRFMPPSGRASVMALNLPQAI